MTTPLLNAALAGLVLLAAAVVLAPKIRRAVVLMAVFSMFASFVYLLLAAPDVALAEAVIGSTLSTIVLLVAIKRYQVFTIYYTRGSDMLDDREIDRRRNSLLGIIEGCLLEHEMESQVIYTVEDTQAIVKRHACDLLVEEDGQMITLHGEGRSYLCHEITDRLLTRDASLPLAVVDLSWEEDG